MADPQKVTEHIKHSWYEGELSKRPSEGETQPKYDKFDLQKNYSWMKAPRYEKEPMEVGPLSRVLVAYARGDKATKKISMIP
jgi:[NiFe] hydrogenase large subunit